MTWCTPVVKSVFKDIMQRIRGRSWGNRHIEMLLDTHWKSTLTRRQRHLASELLRSETGWNNKASIVGGQIFVVPLLPFRAGLCAYSSHCLVSFQLAGCIPLRAPVGPASGWASIIGFDRGPMN